MTCSREALRGRSLEQENVNSGVLPSQVLQERLLGQLMRQDHFATIGELMNGLVHNMNGPLQVLSIQVELLKKLISDEEKILEAMTAMPSTSEDHGKSLLELQKIRTICEKKIGQLEKEMERLQDITSLVATRCSEHADILFPDTVDLNEVVRHEISLLHADLFFKHQIQKKLNLTTNPICVQGRYLDFLQALNHVLKNAIDAVYESEEKNITITTKSEAGKVILSIQDSGEGISPAIQSKLFELFFTTKPQPHAGLGLFLAKKILEPFGARFQVTSEPGATEIMIIFDCHAQER